MPPARAFPCVGGQFKLPTGGHLVESYLTSRRYTQWLRLAGQ